MIVQDDSGNHQVVFKPGHEETLMQIVKQIYIVTLAYYYANRTDTAVALGVCIRTVRNKIKEWKL